MNSSPWGRCSRWALLVALVLVPPRLTPLIPGMAGVVLAGVTVAHLVRPRWTALVPDTLPLPVMGGVPILGRDGAVALAEAGLLLPLALALLVPLVFPSRWRSYRPRGAHAIGEDDEDGFADLADDDSDD
ncbi:hypothetical protein ABH917_001493 [Thermobifida halotolerans]|uniref:hypothetical protein n=1 Tax=Thermobifida halotolerans TaxID=483545 RepID=UPI00351198D9